MFHHYPIKSNIRFSLFFHHLTISPWNSSPPPTGPITNWSTPATGKNWNGSGNISWSVPSHRPFGRNRWLKASGKKFLKISGRKFWNGFLISVLARAVFTSLKCRRKTELIILKEQLISSLIFRLGEKNSTGWHTEQILI